MKPILLNDGPCMCYRGTKNQSYVMSIVNIMCLEADRVVNFSLEFGMDLGETVRHTLLVMKSLA